MTLTHPLVLLALMTSVACQTACGTSKSTPADAMLQEAPTPQVESKLAAVTFDVTDPANDRVRMMMPARQVTTKRSFAGLHVRGLDRPFDVTLFGNLRLRDVRDGVKKGRYSPVEQRDGAMLVSYVLDGQTRYFGLVELTDRGTEYTWTCETPWGQNLKDAREGFEACLTATYLPGAAL